MPSLSDQFNSHALRQTITNKLNEIEKIIESTNFDDQQKESAIAYQMLLYIMLTSLSAKSLPLVPKTILDNLNVSVSNLSTSLSANSNEISKDKIKLELTKSFFDKQFDNRTNDCVLLPKEISKILNTLAKNVI